MGFLGGIALHTERFWLQLNSRQLEDFYIKFPRFPGEKGGTPAILIPRTLHGNNFQLFEYIFDKQESEGGVENGENLPN